VRGTGRAEIPGRYEPEKVAGNDIIKIIKEKKATFLLINLVLSSYQKRLAKQFNINPGRR